MNNNNNHHLTIETDDSLASLLELAANDDVDAVRRCLGRDPAAADEPGLWYGRKKSLEQRTPLMVAATYGSLSTLDLLLSLPSVDVNRRCGPDGATALHCAASGAAATAVDAVKLLIAAGADLNALDSNGLRPADVITVPPNSHPLKTSLRELLGHTSSSLSSSDEDLSPLSDPLDKQQQPTGKKEYPIDPSLPDIKNSVYATDEFRMYSFKVRPCSRAYSHDWTECPFVHPGENARRRDPRKYHYSCVPCPDFRKGACRRGDMCEYAHGVFECWLHPAQYRTRLCKDGTACARRVCFFAHTAEELRPLYVSTGSAVPSPTAVLSPFTPPLSPSASNGSLGWAGTQPNVPALHLPGSSLQLSRLRTSLSARDMPWDELSMFNDFGSPVATGSRSARAKTLMPSNLDDLFSAEMGSSPRYGSDQGAVFSPTHKTAVLNQFQQQQSMLSPINTGHSSLFQAPISVSSPGRMSPRSVEPGSPIGGSRLAAFTQRETLRSLSSRDLGSGMLLLAGSPVGSPWSKWGSPSGAPDWGVNGEELGRLRRSSSFELRSGADEPDVSWVQSLVKDTTPEKLVSNGHNGNNGNGPSAPEGSSLGSESRVDESDEATVIGQWLDQLQLDQMVVQ